MSLVLAIAETRAWVERVVIGLNLCPFAKAPQVKGQVRYALCESAEPEALLAHLLDELRLLASADPGEVETTLLIHPRAGVDFADYNEFLGTAEAAVAMLGLEGVLQVASFHPRYRFAGSSDDDIGNATNRSPYPMLHLLREQSIARAVAAFPDPAAIFEANIATLRQMGGEGWAALQRRCREDAERAAASAAQPGRAATIAP